MEYFFVYILQCADGSYYVGHTDNLEKRFSEHQNGVLHGYTKSRVPVVLIYSQHFTSRDEARAAEYKIKRWTRKKKEALVAKKWKTLKVLAKKCF